MLLFYLWSGHLCSCSFPKQAGGSPRIPWLGSDWLSVTIDVALWIISSFPCSRHSENYLHLKFSKSVYISCEHVVCVCVNVRMDVRTTFGSQFSPWYVDLGLNLGHRTRAKVYLMGCLHLRSYQPKYLQFFFFCKVSLSIPDWPGTHNLKEMCLPLPVTYSS